MYLFPDNMNSACSSNPHSSMDKCNDGDSYSTDVSITRLEKEAEFLFHVARCAPKDFQNSITRTSDDQLKAIIECLRNYGLFKKSVSVQVVVQINKILSQCLIDSPAARKEFIKKHKFVQSVLARIFLMIILTEFHFMFCE